ncbi:MAG: ribonuclease E inhibitor RraB [Rhodobacteraceae bacterium]|nr:ribonuclease E inhibitor RraB [Paracoccaceae bacterium]
MSHDFDAQKRETFDSFDEMKKGGMTLPQTSIVEFYLLADSDEANWSACEKALQAKGFSTQRDHDEDTLIVTTKTALRITAEVIWEAERKVSEIGVAYDFLPDGWEFGFD